MPALADLLRHIEGARLVRGDAGASVLGISHDTRTLRPGEVFVAVPGFRVNALDLVPRAVAAGASAVVAEAEAAADDDVPYVVVPSARSALADLAAAFHGHPSRRLPVVGVTGTDGKTSTVHLLSAILTAHGLRTGWLTTVNTRIGDEVRPNAAEHTTPEATVVQSTLAEMVVAGLDVAIVETSSHALALDRVRGVGYRVGVFTNLSPEHLNFHGTFEEYRAAKSRLFAALPADGLAVLNADDQASAFMAGVTRAPTRTYALERDADVRATAISLGPDGTRFTVHEAPGMGQRRRVSQCTGASVTQGAGDVAFREARDARLEPAPDAAGSTGMGARMLRTRLVGRFNVANWLAAYAAATYFGATLDDLARAVEQQGPVPGRMNLVQQGQPFPVVVDFAHTPQALEKALDTVRSLVPGRVLLVFGLAGGRDFHNRPVMGELAGRKSDYFMISMDDPYDEDPRAIAAQIADGARAAGSQEGERFEVEIDRRAAIRRVLARAAPGDAVLLAGKGHENRMMVGTEKQPWNDARVAAEELQALGYSGVPSA